MAKLLLNTDAVLTLIVLLIDVIVVKGQTQEGNESKSVKNNFQVELTQKLFTNRSLVVPPYTYNADSSFNPINISLHTHIWSVSDIDLRHQRFTFTGWFVVQYTDPSLSWDTTVYPVDAIFVKPEDIWTPELYVTNSLMPYDQLVKQQMPVVVYANGSVIWSPGDTIITTCPVNIQLFPFDTQTCQIIVAPWVYLEHQVDCNETIFDVYHQSAEWDATETSQTVERYNKYWLVIHAVTLRRKWLFYALNVLLPVLLVSALNSVVFALPVQCGEKMSVSLTTFLTLAVFMTLIQDSLPSNSDTVCYLAVYLGAQLVLSVVVVILTAARVACHHHHSASSASTPSLHDVHFHSTLQGVQQGDTAGPTSKKEKVTMARDTDWERVGLLMDRICLPLFTVLSVLSFALYCVFVSV